jgi:GNAT superfamily N-acetyltransferase
MIKKIKFSDLENDQNFPDLRDEYSKECSIAGLPPIAERFEVYKRMEDVGFFHLFGAYSDDELVGFVSVIISIIPHYGVAVVVAESLFLSKDFRATTLGRSLINAAEDCAKDAGSPGLLFSAPTGGKLSKLLPNIGYRETNVTFFKDFS